jgi:hypothetical protein
LFLDKTKPIWGLCASFSFGYSRISKRELG